MSGKLESGEFIRDLSMTGWASISRIALDDQRLSLKAKGMLGWLISRPTDHKLYARYAQHRNNISQKSWQSIRRELESAGYLQVVREKKHGKFVWKYFLTDSPSCEIEDASLDAAGIDAKGTDSNCANAEEATKHETSSPETLPTETQQHEASPGAINDVCCVSINTILSTLDVQLSNEENIAITKALSVVPENRQALIVQEFVKQRPKILNPIGWFHSMVRAEQSGSFMPSSVLQPKAVAMQKGCLPSSLLDAQQMRTAGQKRYEAMLPKQQQDAVDRFTEHLLLTKDEFAYSELAKHGLQGSCSVKNTFFAWLADSRTGGGAA